MSIEKLSRAGSNVCLSCAPLIAYRHWLWNLQASCTRADMNVPNCRMRNLSWSLHCTLYTWHALGMVPQSHTYKQCTATPTQASP